MDALSASRATRSAKLDRYAEIRREAKRRGERTPRPLPSNPLSLAIWFGDERRARPRPAGTLSLDPPMKLI